MKNRDRKGMDENLETQILQVARGYLLVVLSFSWARDSNIWVSTVDFHPSFSESLFSNGIFSSSFLTAGKRFQRKLERENGRKKQTLKNRRRKYGRRSGQIFEDRYRYQPWIKQFWELVSTVGSLLSSPVLFCLPYFHWVLFFISFILLSENVWGRERQSNQKPIFSLCGFWWSFSS